MARISAMLHDLSQSSDYEPFVWPATRTDGCGGRHEDCAIPPGDADPDEHIPELRSLSIRDFVVVDERALRPPGSPAPSVLLSAAREWVQGTLTRGTALQAGWYLGSFANQIARCERDAVNVCKEEPFRTADRYLNSPDFLRAERMW